MKILLADIMYKKNMSVRQVSMLTGVSRSTVSRIANNQISPTADILECIARGLEVHITDLIESPYK